nr:Chain P, gag polyprotein [synthetic construct]
PATIMMQRGN